MHTLSRPTLVAAALLLLGFAAPPAGAREAGRPDPEARYRACMRQVGEDAGKALATAEAWAKKDGGEAARHCAAAAKLALGRFGEAAELLEALAQDKQNTTVLRASLWAQAAHARLSGDQPERAEAAAAQALLLVPGEAELLVLRARARAAQGRFAEAIDDLDRAITDDPEFADAYVFRASALRQQGALDRASADLDKALTLDPRHPEALLERGIVRVLSGDAEGGRADWGLLTETAPKSPAAEQARLLQEKLEKANAATRP